MSEANEGLDSIMPVVVIRRDLVGRARK